MATKVKAKNRNPVKAEKTFKSADPSIDWDWHTITKPGLYAGIPLPIYHSAKICNGPSVSSSGLRKIFSESPAHFYDEWYGNPNAAPDEDTASFVRGRALHHLILGQEFFAKLFVIRPPELAHYKTGEMRAWHGNNTECKEWLAKMEKDGKTILTPADVEAIKGMAESLGNMPLIRHGALNGWIERSMVWKDEETGIWLKSRPDAIPNASGDYTDLKMTISVQHVEMAKTIYKYGYHQQLALVREGARALGLPFHSATLVFVEQTRPYCPAVVTIKETDLERGDKQNRAALRAMAECLKNGRWPGPGGQREDATYVELPEYAQKRIDDRLTIGIQL